MAVRIGATFRTQLNDLCGGDGDTGSRYHYCSNCSNLLTVAVALQEFMKAVDTSGDKKISLDEFLKFFKCCS